MRARLSQWSELVDTFLTADPKALAKRTQPHRWLSPRFWKKRSVIDFNSAFSHLFQAIHHQLLTPIELKAIQEAIAKAKTSEVLYEAANAECLGALLTLNEVAGSEAGETKVEALEMLQDLAHVQHPTALFCLGWMHQEGIHLPKDTERAQLYFLQASRVGQGSA